MMACSDRDRLARRESSARAVDDVSPVAVDGLRGPCARVCLKWFPLPCAVLGRSITVDPRTGSTLASVPSHRPLTGPWGFRSEVAGADTGRDTAGRTPLLAVEAATRRPEGSTTTGLPGQFHPSVLALSRRFNGRGSGTGMAEAREVGMRCGGTASVLAAIAVALRWVALIAFDSALSSMSTSSDSCRARSADCTASRWRYSFICSTAILW
mmetsp:Transcript_4394/g.10366  ORF Transcript_4394/g.10366 Transcript_4394/m.10366 type:complete len:211 (-) Transcript_4394:839-1471(-)